MSERYWEAGETPDLGDDVLDGVNWEFSQSVIWSFGIFAILAILVPF